MAAHQEPDLRREVSAQCARIGADPLLVQGAGGNVSWKTNDTVWVKASGTWLADAESRDIFVPVDLAHLRDAIDRSDFAVTPRVQGVSVLRPSIETLLHALMPQRVVVHVHAIDVLARLVRENFQDSLRDLDLPNIHWAVVPYLKPGADLAAGVQRALVESPGANVIFLCNHGVVVGADSVRDVVDLLDAVVAGFREPEVSLPVITEPLTNVVDAAGETWFPVPESRVHDLARLPVLFERLKSSWALYPDHVVFLGATATTLEGEPALRALTKHAANGQDVVFVRGLGVYSRGALHAGKVAQLLCYRDILARQTPDAVLSVLTQDDVCGLLNWDAERYRMQMAK